MMTTAWAWSLAVAYAIPFGAIGIKLDVTDSDNANMSIPSLLEGQAVVDNKCFKEMKKGRPTLAYLRRGMPYKGLWERTLLNELLRDVGDVLICDLPGTEASILEVLAKSGDDPVGFIVAGFPKQMPLTDLVGPIQKSPKKPRVLFHFSDERGQYKPSEIYPKVMPQDGLVLRQYQFWSDLPTAPRTRIVPLGYDVHLDFAGDSCAAAIKNAAGGPSQRSHNWAFVGGMNSGPGDSAGMVSELLGAGHSFKATDQLDSKEAFVGQKEGAEMIEVYKKAVFAPHMPSFRNNEDRRLYESVIAGAIPVIVGDNHTQRAYSFHSWRGEMPPFIFAPTWKDAKTTMDDFLQNDHDSKLALEALQKKLPTWYCEWVSGIQLELAQKLSR